MYQHPLLMAPRRDSDSECENNYQSPLQCCVPKGECHMDNVLNFGILSLDDLRNAVRVICTNENCTSGQYMHVECFAQWENGVMNNFKNYSWSENLKHDNMWTKKCFDLIYKACTCRCGRGYLRKDLNWSPSLTLRSKTDSENAKKKKTKKTDKKSSFIQQKNSSTFLAGLPSENDECSQSQHHISNLSPSIVDNMCSMLEQQLSVSTPMHATTVRRRTGSLTSSNTSGSSSPASSTNGESIASPVQNNSRMYIKKRYLDQNEQFSERIRVSCGSNGIFSRRLDFSLYNVLPKQRVNSIEVKIEDEGKHGNDDTRIFVLSSLAAHKKTNLCCLLCKETMLVYDRYPLVDGTLFLSPIQHTKDCIETKFEGRVCYLSSVCLECLDGNIADKIFRCRFCAEKWDGSSLLMGTMYSFDVFAAMPCCSERLKCNNCFKLLLHPHQRLNYFSDYTHSVRCPYCQSQDTHFVKPLSYCYTNKPFQQFQQWP